MSNLRQILAVTLLNLSNLPRRWATSIVVVFGIGAVVAVLVTLMAMAAGFQKTMQGKGQTDRVVMLRGGSNSEINGSITFEQAAIIENKPGIAKAEKPIIAGESYVSINLKKRESGRTANVPLRGVGTGSFKVRPEISLLIGRNIQFGKFEMIVGRGVQDQFVGLQVGDVLTLRNTDWHIVGVFEADGSVFESELWVDVLMLNDVFGRGSTFSSLAARLETSETFALLSTALESDGRLTVKLHRETDFYSAQSEITSQLIRGVGAVVCLIMAIGAVFAVLNTLYATVSARATEIATLRALGFGRLSIICSVVVESLCLALVGGGLAGIAAFALLDGYQASTVGTNTQVTFEFLVTPEIVTTGLVLATTLGLIGALIPAARAAMLPVATALRS